MQSSSPLVIHIDPYDTTGRGIAPAVVVRACAMINGNIFSKTITHTYLFVDEVIPLSPDYEKPGRSWPDINYGPVGQEIDYGMDPDVYNDPRYQGKMTEALVAIPTISVVTDLKNLFDPDSGIYMYGLEHGIEWERPASIELLYPDNEPGFQVNAGLRIRGAWARRGLNRKHAFRLFFRSEYGDAKLRYPLFGDEGVSEFDKIDLRTCQNYSWAYEAEVGARNTLLRDVFARDIQKAMNQPCTRSRYYHLYINGVYWGIYMTQERSEAAYASSYFGGNREDYDVIKVDVGEGLNLYDIEATDGTLDSYHRLWEAAMQGFYKDENYYKVQGMNPDGIQNPEFEKLLDADNLIDYMLALYYSADFDGPWIPNNFYGIYNRENPDGFKFFRHDGEHSLTQINMNNTGIFGNGHLFNKFNPAWLHQRLLAHPDYRQRLTDRIYKHCFNQGALTTDACINRFLDRKNTIEMAIIAESARWGDAKVHPARTKDDDWLPEVNFLLNDVLPYRRDLILDQFIENSWYTDFDPPIFSLESGIVMRNSKLEISASTGNIYYTTDGTDPLLPASLRKYDLTTFVPLNVDKRLLVRKSVISSDWYRKVTFNDSSWMVCTGSPGGIGYEKESGYENLISLDVSDKMYVDAENPIASCYIRTIFTLSEEQLENTDVLLLRVKYDDGFQAYLNGSYSSRIIINIPFYIGSSSVAMSSHEAEDFEIFDLSLGIKNLVVGENLLAIQAFNDDVTSPDFLIYFELLAGRRTEKGGDISPNAQKYTGPVAIDESMIITARVLNEDKWSASEQKNFWIPRGMEDLRITEIHYHPLGTENLDDRPFEFIELKNIGPYTLDLSAIHFSQAIIYSFPEGCKLSPGKFIVLAADRSKFINRYQFNPFDQYSGQLSNDRDKIVLQNADNDTLIVIDYLDEYPWPLSADGDGYSLVPKDYMALMDQNNAHCWCASKKIHGSPASDDDNTVSQSNEEFMPAGYILRPNFPNPFNMSTNISFDLPDACDVKIIVFDVLGRKVKTLANIIYPAGFHIANWYGDNDNGQRVSSGVYFLQLLVGKQVFTRKLLLLK
jgi:hypothetical protein